MTETALADGFDVRVARAASGILARFNRAGVLTPADVHVARRLARLAGEDDEAVVLAAALAVRAPRLGHVFVDLESIHRTATVDADEPVDLASLPWPEPRGWAARVAAGPLAGPDRPLRLAGSALYLDRYWCEEVQVARDLLALARPADADDEVLAAGLERLAGDDEDQRAAAVAAVRSGLAVIAGGPGTGKTTTVARVVALLAEQAAAAGAPPPLVALAAPTGKAAARLQEAVHEEAASLDVPAAVRAQLAGLQASTLHRLLGWTPRSHSRFRHHRGNRLPHDVVIVDETSMVSLTLMARLVEAVRPAARLVLVGDPGQLTSIEAGAVLGDIVGPAAERPRPGGIGDGIVVLRRVHRFGGAIQRLAGAIRAGNADEALGVLAEQPPGVTWARIDAAAGDPPAALRDAAVAAGRAVVEAAREGEARRALDRLRSFRLLCAHRRGPYGVAGWLPRVEAWLAAEVPGFASEGPWYLGRPLLVTENDHAARLYNGDTGVVVRAGESRRPAAAFERRDEVVLFSPSRLAAVETVYAMTVHKSQGSQFDTAAVVLPDPGSPILTRELLYTAVTRARSRLLLVGTEESVRAAVTRPIARASGLRGRLWGEEGAR